jgi:hypothetical protein
MENFGGSDMTICNDHDGEVCYECRDCPACAIQAELDKAEEKIEELKQQVEELELNKE